MKLWEKGYVLDKEAEAFTTGKDYSCDQKLVEYDCIASAGHAKMLQKMNYLTKKECKAICAELKKIIRLEKKGKFKLTQSDEDCHTKIESHLTKKLGKTGKKIHTLRSRNDQVMAALNLYSKAKLGEILSEITALQKAMKKAGTNNFPMPGYTHMQRAMPSSTKMWFGSFIEMLKKDSEAIGLAIEFNNENPLGSGAGYGFPFKVKNSVSTKELGFAATHANALAVQNFRAKKELFTVHALLEAMLTLNKFASDLMLFTTSEFGFFGLPKELCTGSSIMPQKKNYDVLEIMRSNSGVVFADYSKIFAVSNNLPSGYNRDVQHTKAALMDSIEITIASIKMAKKIAENLVSNPEKMKEACTPELYAAEEALRLVSKGEAFRDAYRKTAKKFAE